MFSSQIVVVWLMVILVLGLLLGPVKQVESQRTIDPDGIEKAQMVENNLEKYWQNLTQIYGHYMDWTMRPYRKQWKMVRTKLESQNDVRGECLNVVQYILEHPTEQQWTAQMIDSNRLLPPGILSGTTTELGDFDQCLSIKGQFVDVDLVGKYCLATVNIPRTRLFDPISINRSALEPAWIGDLIENWYDNDNFYSLTNAVCFPSICHQNEIRSILLQYYPSLDHFEFDVKYCQSSNEPTPYDRRIWIALTIVLFPWLFIIAGTLLDIVNNDPNQPSSQFHQALLCFSLVSNLKQLFQIQHNHHLHSQTNQVEIDDKIRFKFVHGIRAIASNVIVMAHTGALLFATIHTPVSIVSHYPFEMLTMSRSLWTQPFYNGPLVIHIFFMLSGLFFMYTTASTNQLKTSLFQMVTIRWLRFTPAVIGTICMMICLEMLGSGPLFQHNLLWPTLGPCYQNWWYHVFYVNIRGYQDSCLTQTWYLTADMQLHLVGFLLLWLYARYNSRLTYLVSALLALVGMSIVVLVVATGLTKLNTYHIAVDTKFPPAYSLTTYIGFAPYTYAVPFFIGTIIGQRLLENKPITISKNIQRICWLLSITFFLLIPFASYPTVQDRQTVLAGDSSIAGALTMCLVFLVWCLSVGWIIFGCATNPNNPISRFLSSEWFLPLSRLSFSLFLTHFILIWFNALQERSPLPMASIYDVSKVVCRVLFQSYLCSVLLYVSFDAPIFRLIKLRVHTKPVGFSHKTDRNNNKSANKVD